jgi:uncharacterized protein with FMN-binding domain
MTPKTTAARLIAGSIAAATATVVLAGCSSSDGEPSLATSTSSSPRSAEASDQEAPDGSYRDGTFEATGWYGGLPSHHDVTLTISDDLITDVTISTPAEDPTSLEYQQAFAAALPDEVIGRHVDEVQIDRLAGASGCPDGFMDALEQIKAEAAI